MKLKIIFGIILPATLVIILGLYGAFNIGLDIQKKYQKSLIMDDIYKDGRILNIINLGEITIKNDNLFSSRTELNEIIPCVIDKEGVKSPLIAGSIQYEESDINYNYNQDIYYDSSVNQKSISVEVSPGKIKKIQINLVPSSEFRSKTGEQLTLEYADYDDIAIVESSVSRYDYNFCSTLSEKELKNAVKVNLNL